MSSVINKTLFLQRIRRELDAGAKHNKKSIEKIATSYLITDKTQVKEFTELAVNGQTKSKEDTLNRWESAIKESTGDRKARHIITTCSRLLQLIKESLLVTLGGVKKGILMPENWNPGNEVQQKVEVPISRALKIIRSLGNGQQITTSNNISIFKQHDKFKIIISSSKQRAGDVYLDEDILKLVDSHNRKSIRQDGCNIG